MEQYEPYCLAKGPFYETPTNRGAEHPGFGLDRQTQERVVLSMDLATGSAGVLLALGVALHDQPAHLPFFDAAEPGRSEQFHGEPGKGLSEPDKVWKEV